ncbi:tetratricopeptide repeat protein [Luteibaculum oceani]|uniref:Tetratricopeptide repeat protein n=1 Tax=Luteibaculum oceani TaxID=1294296 RepID=A0A5C6V955_9FLAO|nr:tetratricopeptide repeat protein [Luteibaculum oceani]TXC81679.1 tetratricopeptide repeat protein [Luteibaculum oceani]
MHKSLTFSLLILFCSLNISLLGQKSFEYQPDHVLYKSAMDLYYKKKYAAAQKQFEKLIETEADPNSEISVAASYHRAACALQLFNRDAEYLLKDFLKKHPDSRWNESIYYQLGTYSYRKKDHEDVVMWLKKVSPQKLSEADQEAYYFKLGFSQFNLGMKEDALRSFLRIKDNKGDYFLPANYYYGHLNYEQGRYQNALESFERIKDDENFKDLVKFYIIHIYYQQKKYDEMLAEALPILEEGKSEKEGEIARMAGEAYYHRQEFSKALPYLEQHSEAGLGRSAEDNYQLAYCYFKTGQYEKAVKYFNYVSSLNDRMGQVANYQLAESYLKLIDKKAARAAFRAASKMSFDKQIKEDALFNYAKLAYELSYNPYSEAINAFEEYLNTYPNSERVDEVNEILIYVYLTTRNYEAALSSIEKIEKKDFRLRSAYQYLAYNRGVELFLAKDYREALVSFKKVGQFDVEKKLMTASLFWQGECYYKMAEFPRAEAAYTKFLKQGNVYGSGYYHEAQYNLGYVYYKQENFEQAKKYFRNFVTGKADISKELKSDGLIRTGDCFYVQKDYQTAADFYSRAKRLGGPDEDYATYQLALCQGFEGNEKAKVNTLKGFAERYSESAYAPNAVFELGDAYFKQGNNDKALETFNALVTEYPNGDLARKSLLKSGLILYRSNRVDDALNTFKRVAESYPNYRDAKEAIQRAEDIYVELGRVEEYNDWVQNLSYANISTAALDSVNYRSAENFYTKEDCENAIDAFERYLNKFKPAIFETNAHFYMAECYYRKESYDLAKEYYEKIVSKPDNKFTEPSLITVAYLNFLDSNYTKALEEYNRLEEISTFKINRIEAKIGQMRCYKMLDKARETMDYADKVLFYSGIPEDIRVEALLTKAKAEKRLGRIEDAYNTFDSLATSTKTIEGAEARYEMALIEFERENYTNAEDMIFESTNIKPTYDDWLAKSFILLSDVYVKTDNLFQAKATLQSIIDFHEGDDLVNLAKQKMEDILALEAKQNEGDKKPTEIQFNKGDEQYEKLYDTETESDTLNAPITQPIDSLNSTPKTN